MSAKCMQADLLDEESTYMMRPQRLRDIPDLAKRQWLELVAEGEFYLEARNDSDHSTPFSIESWKGVKCALQTRIKERIILTIFS